MRQIKFRGKEINTGEWVYGSLVQESCGDVWIFPEGDTYCNAGGDFYSNKHPGICIVKPETVGQFTGLKDKNGKEIYEGDVLEVNYADEGSYLEVRFVRGVFAFLWNGDLDDEFPCNAPTHEWARAVGNIHDNPELIKLR